MHYAKTTQIWYRKIIGQYIEFVGEKSVATATHFDIRRYIARVSENGASLNTVYRDLGVLRLFYDFLNLGGVVHYVAPRFIKLRRPCKKNSLRPLSEWQVQRIISATRTPRERALIEVFYATGCRLWLHGLQSGNWIPFKWNVEKMFSSNEEEVGSLCGTPI